MKYHKFTPNGYDQYHFIVGCTKTKRIVLFNELWDWGDDWRHTPVLSRLPPKKYRALCNTTYFQHEVLTESEYLLELI